MNYIDSLYLQLLKEKLFLSFMLFVCNTIERFTIIGQTFPTFVEKVKAAYAHINRVYLKYDADFCTEEVQKADENRDKAFIKLRNAIRSFILYQLEEAKTQAAEILLKITDLYGGSDIPSQGVNAETISIVNLVEDLEIKYSAEVETLGIGNLVEELKQAQAVFTEKYMQRVECDSEIGKGAMVEARKKMTKAYRDLVTMVNLAAEDDEEEKLTPFINFMNVEIGTYRTHTGQGQVGSSSGSNGNGSGSDSEGGAAILLRQVKFEFVNGTTISFKVEVGAPIAAPANTEGYRWDPEIPEKMPKRSKTFREVPIDPEKVTVTFHFFDHSEEEIKQAAGTELTAPQNTEGYVWEPEVPATMPAEDTSYYEMPAPDNGGGSSSGGSGSNQDWDV